MVSLLWNGSGLFIKGTGLVQAPGECCCCTDVCTTPDCGAGILAWVQCSGDGCTSNDFSTCLTGIPPALSIQNFNVLANGDYCCNCSGFYLKDIYGCCSGVIIPNESTNLLVPIDSGEDCGMCFSKETISLNEEESHWIIPICAIDEYICVEEEY